MWLLQLTWSQQRGQQRLDNATPGRPQKRAGFYPKHNGKLFTSAGLLFLWFWEGAWEKPYSTVPTLLFWETLSYKKVNSFFHPASIHQGNKTNSHPVREISLMWSTVVCPKVPIGASLCPDTWKPPEKTWDHDLKRLEKNGRSAWESPGKKSFQTSVLIGVL